MINIEIELPPDAGGMCVGIVDRLYEYAPLDQRTLETVVAALSIPERYRIGIASIAGLPDASFADLVQALKTHPVGKNAAALALEIESGVPSISFDDRKAIIAAVSAMQTVKKSSHTDAAKMTSDLWEALHDEAPELIKDEDEDTFRTRVDILLNEASLHLTSTKIAGLRSEIERSFCGARVSTDVRTAFPDDATKTPAMTIMHTLELVFHDDMGRHREFYVNLDDNDLMILKDVADRALQKKATLEQLLKKADFELFD